MSDKMKMMCKDAVSRAKINRFCHEIIRRDPLDNNDVVQAFEAFRAYVNCLPAVIPERKTEWIPCSERLPETDGEVLITVLDMEEYYVEVYKGFYQGQEWWTQWCHGCLKIKDEPCGENIVTAWMPLPEPYRKEGEADE